MPTCGEALGCGSAKDRPVIPVRKIAALKMNRDRMLLGPRIYNSNQIRWNAEANRGDISVYNRAIHPNDAGECAMRGRERQKSAE
jgi:hypothetical protein